VRFQGGDASDLRDPVQALQELADRADIVFAAGDAQADDGHGAVFRLGGPG
jgi:hypothetical protein